MRRATNRPDTRALRHIGLDAVLDRHQLEELALHTDVITVSRGEVLATASRTARQFIAVIDGVVDVTDSSGHTFVTRSDCHLVVIVGPAMKSAFHHPGVANWVEQHRAVARPDSELAAPHATRPLALVD
jgi:hypothetical protein